MAQSPQPKFAASADPASTLGTTTPTTGVTYNLNGVMLEVVGNPGNYPAPCDGDHPEWCWPTSILAMGRTVRMLIGGETWRLYRPPNRLQDGRIQVALRPMTGSRSATFNVPVEALDTPLWNVGEAYVPPEPQPAPVLVPDAPTNPIGSGPQIPVEPTEPTPAG